jgi:Protein of unknown function (DUF2510)
MYEFDSVSVSSYEAASLAGKLTDKSRDGWDVVSIVPAGSEITAFLRRESSATSSSAYATEGYAASTPTSEAAGASEPAGWGTAPESGTTTPAPSVGTTAAATAPTQVATSPPTTPTVPPGWYEDPARRFELRYWDGSAWTEHVSRAGQQYRDPPVP